MVAGYRRSLSFPNQPSYSTKSKKTFHVRSASLPCRTHPIISQLKDEINELKSWGSKSDNRTSVWLCNGLNRVKVVHESLDDLLQLPLTQESLSDQMIEKLLEDFLRFVDVYGIFQMLILTLKEEFMAAQVAVRRRDESKMAIHLKNLNKTAKDMSKLVSTVQSIGKYSIPDNGTEITDIIRDVIQVTVLVSVELLGRLSTSFSFQKPSCMGLNFGKKAKKVKMDEAIEEFEKLNIENLWGLKKKGDAEVKMASKKLHQLEDSIVEIEGCGERTFRSLMNTRVSLLNVLTQ
ncbi:uncharacterized protein LOC111373787 [Olea europaea var. sylvestris]|uniref:DUF241 domain protein n=1 Tax=Olea europaea subsp. europaea TaxID=158383 RepID=A0A8S0T287_OLEEU|nr:uncharacterized protein LOC111373787 [Olea europaea var. sylvestris]CAA2998519.1 Hypothetical predicted protein [Olea europaea subsp. europaea]